MIVAATAAYSRTVFIVHHPCIDGGGGSFSKGFIDDRTGKSYVLFRDCFGNTCFYPLHGPFEPRPNVTGPASDWILPSNYHDQVALASTITTPGADVGIWVIDRTTGDTLRFRNPVDEAEREQYYQMWMENENHGSSTYTEQDLQNEFSDVLLDSWRREVERQTTEERMVTALIDKYWHARFGENGWPGQAEMPDITTAASIISRTRSSIAIKQAPTPTNGHVLVMVPTLPELSGQATIYDAMGGKVWSGDVATETSVALDHLSSGLYIIRGDGKDIPISIVR